MLRRWAVLILPILFVPLIAWAYVSPGQPQGFINDFADLLTDLEEIELEAKLGDFERTSTNEITVVTIPNLGGDTIENFAVKLFEEWGIGKRKEDNGLLLLIAKEDRQMRIEVGYGLEGVLTDAQTSSIIRNILVPAFQQTNYSAGITDAVEKIIGATQGEAVPSTTPRVTGDIPVDFIILAAIIVLIWLASVLGRTKSWWLGGAIGGGAAIVITFIAGLIFSGLVAFLILVPLGLLLDFLVSRTYRAHRSHRDVPWWAGGGWGGGSHRSGGFGGFSGGSSGGGGSSGSW